MTTTFFVRRPAAAMRLLIGDRRCRVERLDEATCNVVFFDEAEWRWFETWADEQGLDYELV